MGVGLACGTEKGSYVAACAEVEIDPGGKTIAVRRVCQVFECGAILNPANLLSQVQGAIIMGLGPALARGDRASRTAKSSTPPSAATRSRASQDVPELDIHLLNRPDLDPAGAGETPIIAIAPAIANAVFHATGMRLRSMPMRLQA